MASMREHLTEVHKRTAEHHSKKATSHVARATHFKKLATQLGKTETTEASKDSKAILEALAVLHEEMSQEHSDMAEFHSDCAEKCAKAVDAGDLNKLVPTRVSTIAPPRAVPRTGAPPIQRRAVDPELEKALGINEADWHVEETSLR